MPTLKHAEKLSLFIQKLDIILYFSECNSQSLATGCSERTKRNQIFSSARYEDPGIRGVWNCVHRKPFNLR